VVVRRLGTLLILTQELLMLLMQHVTPQSLMQDKMRALCALHESGWPVVSDAMLREAALDVFLERVAVGRVLLRVVDQSACHGAVYLADLRPFSWDGWVRCTKRAGERGGERNVKGGGDCGGKGVEAHALHEEDADGTLFA